ncbi:MAG: M28 family peptidase, partial [Ignavibacteriales bacterium]|nr:M28 family peptidase [Ignavibacteriales bacterium]
LRYPTHFFSLNYSAPEGPGSDHEPFLQRSVPSLAFVSDVGYPIHTAQDNFENFNPAGLKRTGDLILKLVERFDSGIPSRDLEEYWLYTIGSIPIFVLLWCLWILIVVAVLITIVALIIVRKKREPRHSPNRIRWSGLKMFLFSLIIVTCGWFSSDLIGWLKGVRHPWLSHIYPYYILSVISVLIGGWTVKRLDNKIRLSQCPYIFFKRSIIMLVVFLIGLGILNLKLTVEPAVALLLISLAMLVRNPIIKIILAVLSPWWMLRLIFSEWSELFFRQIAKVDTTGFGLWFLGNGSVVFVLSIYILPYLFAIAAVVNDSPRLKTLCVKLQSNLTLIVLVISFIGLGIYLMTLPVFNNRWQKEIKINEEYDITTSSKKISLESPEYLSGVRIFHAGGDTLISLKISSVEIKPSGDFDTTWLNVERKIEKQQFGDTSHYDIGLGIRAKHRPYTISIAYYIDGKDLNAFDTPFQFRTNRKKEKRIEWYSFPDSILTIPVRFSVIGSDTVKERIEVTFNKLAYPMEIKGEMINLIPRTKVIARNEYE